MAEGLAKMHLEDFSIASAGTKPDPINENAIAAMNDFGIDISNN